jgi:hypothetical protein
MSDPVSKITAKSNNKLPDLVLKFEISNLKTFSLVKINW